MWKRHLTHLVVRCVVNIQRTNLKYKKKTFALKTCHIVLDAPVDLEISDIGQKRQNQN